MNLDNNSSKRITYIDSAKGLGIIFVVMAHLLGVLVLTDPKPLMEPVWKYLCTVTIAFFFTASGFTMAITNEASKDFKSLISKKSKNILYPYFTFSIIYLVYKICAVYITHNKDYDIKDIIECLLDSISFRGSSVLWFLSALFFGSLFFDFLLKKVNRIPAFIINTLLCLLVLFFSFIFNYSFWQKNYLFYFMYDLCIFALRIFTSSFCLNLGYEVFYLIQKIDERIGAIIKIKIVGIISAVIFLAISFYASTKANVDFAKNYYENPLFCFLGFIFGSIGLMLLTKNLLDCKLLQFLGKKALIIMLTHIDLKVLPYALLIAYGLNKHVSRAKEYVLYFSIFILVILFEAAWIWLIDHPLKFLLKKQK